MGKSAAMLSKFHLGDRMRKRDGDEHPDIELRS
jgi:hypothetical protein